MVVATAAVGLALGAITVAITLAGVDDGNAGLAAAGRASMVLAPMAAGCYAWWWSAVYLCCREALQNAAKHADGASRVSVLLSEDGRLRFEVRDDGPGFGAHAAPGAGVTNMRDRIGAVGGELELSSAPGGGAVVIGSVPLP